MVALPELYGLAEKQNIPILRYPLPENGSMSLQLPGGAQFIGMRRDLSRVFSAQKTEQGYDYAA